MFILRKGELRHGRDTGLLDTDSVRAQTEGVDLKDAAASDAPVRICKVVAVAVMTDTDNTISRLQACHAAMRLVDPSGVRQVVR